MYEIIKKEFKRDKSNQKFNNSVIIKRLNLKRIDDALQNISYEDKDWRFDSKREYYHFIEFQQQEKAGTLSHYIFKPPKLKLTDSYKEVKLYPSYYLPDHLLIYPDGRKEYADTKGMITAEFKLKQKFVYEKYRILIKVLR